MYLYVLWYGLQSVIQQNYQEKYQNPYNILIRIIQIYYYKFILVDQIKNKLTMETLKQARDRNFASKHAHLKRIKQQRAKQTDRSIAKFERMNASQLLEFMQDNFDDYSYRNSGITVEINKTILSRIRELKQQFENKNHSKYYEFLRKGGVQITKQQQQKSSINSHIPSSIKTHTQHFVFNTASGVYKIQRVNINSKDEQLSQIAYFYLQSKQNCDDQLSYKRIKKESIQILSKLIEVVNKIKELNN